MHDDDWGDHSLARVELLAALDEARAEMDDSKDALRAFMKEAARQLTKARTDAELWKKTATRLAAWITGATAGSPAPSALAAYRALTEGNQ
jgi:Lon protease-like protein